MRFRGFTLIELLVTMALISLLATMALPLAELTMQRSKEAELRSALRQIRSALDAYKQAFDEGRIIQHPGDSGYPRNLNTLVQGIDDAKSPVRARMYFLRSIPRDPFSNPSTMPEETWGLRSYRSSHELPQRGDDVYDVYSQSSGVGINGIAYKEW